MTTASIGILSAAAYFPDKTITIEQVFKEEGVTLDADTAARLGIKRVHVFEGESPTDMAVAVSKAAIEKAGLTAMDIHAIIDFSVMPQRYVEPAWSMSNELQAELGAKNAFTLGYSGGGCANLHVAIKFATALIKANDDVDTVLLVASDKALPKNRIIDRGNPVTVLGDAASALIIKRGAPNSTIIDTEMSSIGRLHDVRNIPGGGVAHPTRVDLYKLVLDRAKYDSVDRTAAPKKLAAEMLKRNSVSAGLKSILIPNTSNEDMDHFAKALDAQAPMARDTLASTGHVHSTDLILNYMTLEKSGLKKGDYVMMASHGMGFLAGVTLLQY